MALTAAYHPAPTFGRDTNPWQHFQRHGHVSFFPDSTEELAIDDSDLFSSLPEPSSPRVKSERPMPEFVQPQDLHPQDEDVSTASPTSPVSLPVRTSSIDSSSSAASLNQHLFRRMSMAAMDLNDDSYRPRNTPAKRKKTVTGRIQPRSDKHARELELNRKAATKCRNRQKIFIEQLQYRCKREEEKMHIQSSLVSALHDEVAALRNEVMRQSFCDCRFLQSSASMSMIR